MCAEAAKAFSIAIGSCRSLSLLEPSLLSKIYFIRKFQRMNVPSWVQSLNLIEQILLDKKGVWNKSAPLNSKKTPKGFFQKHLRISTRFTRQIDCNCLTFSKRELTDLCLFTVCKYQMNRVEVSNILPLTCMITYQSISDQN